MCAEASHCLVDGVVHRLVHQVVKALLTNVANIHGRTLTHGLQSLEHLNITRGVVLVLNLFVSHFILLSLIGCKGTKKPRNKRIKCVKKSLLCFRLDTVGKARKFFEVRASSAYYLLNGSLLTVDDVETLLQHAAGEVDLLTIEGVDLCILSEASQDAVDASNDTTNLNRELL